MKKYIIDRFEGKHAVLEQEDSTFKNVLRINLPKGIKEGDVLVENAKGKITIDKKETAKRKKEINDLMNSLFLD